METGCYIDNSAGIYSQQRVISLMFELCREIGMTEQNVSRLEYEHESAIKNISAAYGSDEYDVEFCEIHEDTMFQLENRLNGILPDDTDHYWYWYDGAFGLYPPE